MADNDKQTIINPPPSSDGSGWAVAIIILILVVVFLLFGTPLFRRGGGINVNVPDKIQIDTNTQTNPQQ